MATAPRTVAAPLRPASRPRPERPAPPLRVVAPRHRRRRAGAVAVLVVASVFGVLFALAAFQTKLAQDQLRLDRLEREIRAAQTDHERLRGEVARLEAPDAVVAAATALGLVAPDPASITYLTPSAEAVAAVTAATGAPADPAFGSGSVADATDAWSALKPLVSGAP